MEISVWDLQLAEMAAEFGVGEGVGETSLLEVFEC